MNGASVTLNRLAPLRRVGIGAGIFCVLVLVALVLHVLVPLAADLDHRLVHDAVAGRSGTLTYAAHASSVFGRTWVLIIATSLLGLALMRHMKWGAFGPLIAILGAELLQHIVKDLVQRPRPPVLHLEHVTGSSFPSGHATESAAFAAALVSMAAGRPRHQRVALTIVCTALVAAIGASRVYLGVHYPTDVITGSLLGSAWGVTSVRLTAAASAQHGG